MRDLLIRFCNCSDMFWFKESTSPWRLHQVHPWAKKVEVEDPVTHKLTMENPILPNDWRERVMNLCEYEFTHQNFGLGFKDLMAMDVATFEEIEERVYAMASKRSEDLNTLTNKNTSGQENDILKGIKQK